MAVSYLEESFVAWLNQNPDVPSPEREFKFHPSRKWRFDMAWPHQKVAVEIEGVLPGGGRHQQIQGFVGDAEKYEAALVLGWCVYRIPGTWIAIGERTIWRPQVMETLKQLLGVYDG